MSKERIWRPILCVATLGLLMTIPALAARGEAPLPSASVTARIDPNRQIRRAVDPEVADRITHALQGKTRRGQVWTETMFDALAVTSGELSLLAEHGMLAEHNRHEIAAYAVLSIVETVVDLHPALSSTVATKSTTDEPSPIEEICGCDKRGSVACGCTVYRTGAGDCEYRVGCPGMLKAGCSVINLEMCVARTVFDLLTATE
jgi:hypothetical protein